MSLGYRVFPAKPAEEKVSAVNLRHPLLLSLLSLSLPPREPAVRSSAYSKFTRVTIHEREASRGGEREWRSGDEGTARRNRKEDGVVALGGRIISHLNHTRRKAVLFHRYVLRESEGRELPSSWIRVLSALFCLQFLSWKTWRERAWLFSLEASQYEKYKENP